MKIKEYQQDIDACRFCFMCRHVCTTARVTSEEEMTPRVRGLMLSMILRGSLEYTNEIAESIYQCCLCEYCKEWCEGGWDLPAAVRAARFDIVGKGLVPENIMKVKNNLVENGNPYGYKKDEIDEELQEKISSLSGKGQTLLLFGYDALYKAPEVARAAIEVLEKAGIEIKTLSEEGAAGYDLYNLGYKEEGTVKIKEFIDQIKQTGCQEIVNLSGSMHYLLVEELDKLDFELTGIEVYHLSDYLLQLIESNSLDFVKKFNKKVSYHEPDYLARYNKIHQSPREILAKIPALELKEMPWIKEQARSTGNGLLQETYPELAEKIIKSRLQEALDNEIDLLVTFSAEDKANLSANLSQKDTLEIMDLVELINNLL